MTVNKWRVFCNTEFDWSYGYLDDGITPTTCFNNTNHEINVDSTNIEKTLADNIVVIQEEHVPTGGNFLTEGFSHNMIANTTTKKSVSFSFPVTSLLARYTTLESHIGDVINLVTEPVTIGVNVSSVNIADTVLHVSSSVLLHAVIGYEIIITDGVNTDFMDIITNINTNTNMITMKAGAVHSFNTNSLIKIQKRLIKNITIGSAGINEHGKSKIGGTYVPTGTIVNVLYTNNSNVDKIFNFEADYLY
jgi:hypothetical protein